MCEFFYQVLIGNLEEHKQEVITLICCDSALRPKSETFRFPYESSSKFSGCKCHGLDSEIEFLNKKKKKTTEKMNALLNPGGTHPCYDNNQLH